MFFYTIIKVHKKYTTAIFQMCFLLYFKWFKTEIISRNESVFHRFICSLYGQTVTFRMKMPEIACLDIIL